MPDATLIGLVALDWRSPNRYAVLSLPIELETTEGARLTSEQLRALAEECVAFAETIETDELLGEAAE